MADDATKDEIPTQREYLKYDGATVGSGVLTGCTDGGDDGSEDDGTNSGSSGTDSEASAKGDEVCLEPVGCIEFDSPSDRYVTDKEGYDEIGLLEATNNEAISEYAAGFREGQ